MGAKWKNGLKRMRNHAVTKYHLLCMQAWKLYVEQNPIDSMLNEQRKEELSRKQLQIQTNRKIICHILDIIKLLAKQNLAFRGHDESESSLNRGNFLEFVHHQAKYNLLLRKHLEGASRNCTYLSPEIQNDLISCMADVVVKDIVCQVKTAKFFSILLDETTDIGHLEQISFILRYVDHQCNIQERFIGMTTTDKTDAQTLTEVVETLLYRNMAWTYHFSGDRDMMALQM